MNYGQYEQVRILLCARARYPLTHYVFVAVQYSWYTGFTSSMVIYTRPIFGIMIPELPPYNGVNCSCTENRNSVFKYHDADTIANVLWNTCLTIDMLTNLKVPVTASCLYCAINDFRFISLRPPRIPNVRRFPFAIG